MSRRGPGGRALGVSLLIHGIIVAPVVLFARPPQAMEFETYRVNLVAAPPVQTLAPEPAPPQVAPAPEPEPERVVPTPEVKVEEPPPKKEPEPEKRRPDVEKPPETQPETRPSKEPATDAEAGGDGLNIDIEGREFPYPDYLSNVIVQVHRYFRWNDETRPRGVVYFEIRADGSVRNIRMVRPSGNRRFDFAVMGAVETAGSRGAFGALPDGYAADILPVNFEVEPPR